MENLETLMTRRDDWVNKTGKFLFRTKKDDLPRMAGAFPMYYEVLANYEKKIAMAYRAEYEGDVVLVELPKVDLNNYY